MPIPITLKEDPSPSHQDFMDELKEKLAVRKSGKEIQHDVIKEIVYKRAEKLMDFKDIPTIEVDNWDGFEHPFRNQIFTGDCREVMETLPDKSVNAVCTSPPYYKGRFYNIPSSTYGELLDDGILVCTHRWIEGKYKLSNRHLREMYTKFGVKEAEEKVTYWVCDCCNAYKGELGHEPTPDMFVRDLAECFDEVYRVLRDDGSCWVNLGYKFKKGGKNAGEYLDIPGLFLQEMRRHGWKCKQIIHWHKPNPMPSSAKRRFCPDHEDIIWFVKDLKKYHFKTQYESLKHPNAKKNVFDRPKYEDKTVVGHGILGTGKKFLARENFGKIKRATWTFSTGSYKGSHYAAYPMTLPVIPIDATVPLFQCKSCGKPRLPIIETIQEKPVETYTGHGQKDYSLHDAPNPSDAKRSILKSIAKKKHVTGFTVPCNCNAGWEPGIILDNFIGAGTTALTAKKMGRDFIGIEVDPEAREVILKRLQLEAELPLYILPEQMTKQQLQEAGAGLKDFFFDLDEWVEELLAAHD